MFHEFLESMQLWSHWLIVMGGLVIGSGFFSSSETALFFLSQDELRRFRVGKAPERIAASLMREPDRLLTAVLFWNLVINLLYFAVTVIVSHKLADAGQSAAAAGFGLFSLFFIILIGEVLPKSFAVVFRKFLARTVSLPLSVAVRILDPIIPHLARLTRIARRTFWPGLVREPHLAAEDLERLIEVAKQSAEVVEHERHVLQNILDLSVISVEEAMRPRGTYVTMSPPVNLADLGGEVPPGEIIALVPEGSDEIYAAVSMNQVPFSQQTNLERIADVVQPVPWCSTLTYALTEMKANWTNVLSVVNEYGETIGIVLKDDILDGMLAAQPSRARRLLQREPVVEVKPGEFHVDGVTTLRYLCLRLGLEYEPTPDGLITLAGLMYELLEHIPVVGDECDWRGYHLKVTDVPQHGWIRVLVRRMESESL
ncbi:CNNM domain-containing protein [Thalassoroseus pseudoceratinae]|uniref:CNNM domain-containing protein n=1 Tax=Thalassoroseus pseudoceratinae TaxID=2713176 RepID=UPI00141E78D7|nr:CNNM domain-containing protein [Thalassoroseus pseudoceratinae]